jgi:NAD(P)-dependent dehydrogenase (short-subunit alcohol dehydrogenase family)
MSARPLEDTTALVTGASRGLGRGIATALGLAAGPESDQDAYLLTAAGLRPLAR